MKQWEVWSVDPSYGVHPCVILSRPGRAERGETLEVLMVRSQRQAWPGPHEVVIDQADEMDAPSLVDCELIRNVPARAVSNRRGLVTVERRRQIVSTLIKAHEWGGI